MHHIDVDDTIWYDIIDISLIQISQTFSKTNTDYNFQAIYKMLN